MFLQAGTLKIFFNLKNILFLQIKWYYYLILAIIDVEANYIGADMSRISENSVVSIGTLVPVSLPG
jgi:hypothetical protein